MPTATATQPVLNRVVKGQYKGYIARVLKQGNTGHFHCELRNLDNDRQVVDWVSPAELKELVKLEPGTMCRVTGGDCDGFFAQVISHEPDSEMYVGNAYCLVITPSGKQRQGWIEDHCLRPCNQLNLKAGDVHAIARMTPEGMLLEVDYKGNILTHQTGKFIQFKTEAQQALVDYLSELTEKEVGVEAETPPKSNVLQFPSRNSVTQEEESGVRSQESGEVFFPETGTQPFDGDKKTPPETVELEETAETEEEDWTYLSSEAEQRVGAIASKLVEITEPYVKSVTDFLWELKFVIFEDDRRKKSQTYGTFEQLCRHLYEECNFPYHPNTAREKANAEQERRLLRQAGTSVEVENMSDTAALELRKLDALKAESEVILQAKRQVVEVSPVLTKKAIASSIKNVSETEGWEDKYKFRYPSPKKREAGEKLEKISRQEIEEIQGRNARLRKENETLQAQILIVQEELGKLKAENEEKTRNEQFLSGMVQTAQEQLDEKDREIQQLKWELEEARRRVS